MVDYWLGHQWDHISDDNPVRILYALLLASPELHAGFDLQNDSYWLGLAELEVDLTLIKETT
jgi:hypothetical protein